MANTNPVYGISRDTRIQLTPVRQNGLAACADANPTWTGKVVEVYGGVYQIAFDNTKCPPTTDPRTNRVLSYYLKPEGTEWKLYPGAIVNNTRTLYELMVIYVKQLSTQDSSGNWNPVYTNSTFRMQLAAQLPTSLDAVPVSVADLLSKNEVEQRTTAAQQVLMKKLKPGIVRDLPGARGDGLGIREPADQDYRREWVAFKADQYISAEILVTDPSAEPVTKLVVTGKIQTVFPQAALINGLGVVYQMDPTASVGEAADVETYAPLYVGRRKLRYFVCIYYDLDDCKVIVASSMTSYTDLLESMGPGGDGRLRLAEYLLSDLKQSTATGQPVPYPGDFEEKRTKDLLKVTQIPVNPTVANVATQPAVPEIINAPAEAPVPTAPAEKAAAAAPAAEGLSIAGKHVTVGELGLVKLPGGGLDVPESVKQFRRGAV